MQGSLRRALATALPSLRWQAGAPPAAAAALLLARGKTTTGIVGLTVEEDARGTLRARLAEVLEAIRVVPESAEYRRSVEKTCTHKLSALASDATDGEVEEMLGRQLEEEIKLCREELALIPKMAGARARAAGGGGGGGAGTRPSDGRGCRPSAGSTHTAVSLS